MEEKRVFEKCLLVMKKLSEHPGYSFFMESKDVEDKEDIMIYRIGVDTVERKLENGEYNYISEWYHEVNSIFSFKESSAEFSHYIRVFVEYYNNLFHKLCYKNGLSNLAWSQHVSKRCKKLSQLFYVHIGLQGQIDGSLFKSDAELEELVKKYRLLQNHSDIQVVSSVLMLCNTKVNHHDKEMSINLRHLSPVAHHILDIYANERLKEQ